MQDFFGPKINAQKRRGKYWSILRKKFLAQIQCLVQKFALQTCHLNSFLRTKYCDLRNGCISNSNTFQLASVTASLPVDNSKLIKVGNCNPDPPPMTDMVTNFNLCCEVSCHNYRKKSPKHKNYVAPIGAFFCTSVSPINGH